MRKLTGHYSVRRARTIGDRGVEMKHDLGTRAWRSERYRWLHVLLAGSGIWVFALIAAYFTQDPVLLPTVLLLGSFLVPFALLFWVFTAAGPETGSELRRPVLDPSRLLLAFAAGGSLGVCCSAFLEALYFRHFELFRVLDVAFVEESVKLLVVWLLARSLTSYSRRDGMLLGATVGLGFSAFESAGYAFDLLLANSRIDLVAVAQIQIERGVLTPIGHSLWTALVAGALFAASSSGRLRLTWNVLLWCGIAELLHAGWDFSNGMAAFLASESTGQGFSPTELVLGQLPETTIGARVLFGFYQTVLLAINAALSVFLGVNYWRKANRELKVPAEAKSVPGTTS